MLVVPYVGRRQALRQSDLARVFREAIADRSRPTSSAR
jgi:hypothetical protein